MEYKDYYKILGVARDAGPEQIKTAYRKLARKFHPDVSKESNAEARFKEVNEAYEVLQDPEKRQAYDRLGSNWRAGQDFRPPPGWESQASRGPADGIFSDFFESLFGARGFGQRPDPFENLRGERRASRGGGEQQVKVTVSLEEAYRGTSREISLTGATQRKLRVKIPAGVQPHQQIRLAGQGGGPGRDLFLQVEIAPHPRFRTEGRDVYYELPVAPWEAALGATLPAPTLGGTVDLSIPPGSQSGRKLRLKGRGLPGDPAGDQYVLLKIVTPPADDPQLRRLYEQLRDKSRFDPRRGS